MDPNTLALMMGAAGGATTEPIYIESVFQTWLYTGNGSTQTITNGIDLAGEGGLVWFKQRNSGSSHELVDTARGVGYGLDTRLTSAQTTSTDLTSFTSTGFSLGYNTGNANFNTGTFASWTFRKAAKFFDVVTYTGDGTSNRLIPHSLNSAPGAVIVKCTSDATRWCVWHRNLAGTNYNLILNTTQAAAAQGDFSTGSASFTSSTFPVNEAGGGNTNVTGRTYVAYLFAHDAGGFGDSGNDSVVKCGSMTSAAPVNLGWEPQFVLLKRTDSTGSWFLLDSMRGFDSSTDSATLFANLSDAEAIGAAGWRLNATGFSGVAAGTYIYIAIRRGPMKTPTDATKVFALNTWSGNNTDGITVNTGITTDLFAGKERSVGGGTIEWPWNDRLRGALKDLYSPLTDAETSPSYNTVSSFASNTSIVVGKGLNSGSPRTYVGYSFRRAPGFFDVVAYTGTGANRTVNHNLGVAPELIITKVRSAAGYWWAVYAASLGATNFLLLNSDAGGLGADSTYWNNTAPTASVFSVGANSRTNLNGGTLIAYLFATCPGVSKVGSYTGTGTTLSIDCGFTAGARFVLIKRTDSTGDWYVWDTARGIVSGNDSYLLLNSTAAEVTNTDYIDPLSSGFQISSTAPAAINANGGSFIYLAVA